MDAICTVIRSVHSSVYRQPPKKKDRLLGRYVDVLWMDSVHDMHTSHAWLGCFDIQNRLELEREVLLMADGVILAMKVL